MTTVTKSDIIRAIKELGITETDSFIFHSSLKSMGHVEGGADTVIDAFLECVKDGTLIAPTLCQKDWDHVYENWHMDADSDVGYITNVLRKRPNAYRSNQATHSVAAIGKDAKYLTETHGETGKRPGIFGDTPFSADSPWEKMYKMNTKIVFVGVDSRSCTFRHYAEYVFIEDCLNFLKGRPEYEEMKNQLWYYAGPMSRWPHIDTVPLFEYLKARGDVKESKCGDATFMCVDSQLITAECMETMEQVKEEFLWDLKIFYPETLEWLRRIKEMRGK